MGIVLLLAVLLLPAQGFAEEAPERDLVGETLGRDIETAGYYELLAWCRQMGLEDSGTRQALQGRLYDYYALPAPTEAKKTAATPKRILSIQSARNTEYFSVEEAGEDYVLLQGDVLVELQEKEAVHRIRAQKVLLNQTANLLTAEGNIEYTFKKGEREESFRGERITFDVESWEGAFFGGGMEGDREVAGKKVRFRFLADSIAKLEKDTVVLDRGRITSCDEPQEPHYSIRARKIWVLAPGEWAIANAVLYIGRIPVLYLPFFFHPGDELFFHPALGYRSREGNFIQTTTYLIGQKQRSPSAISLLAATEEPDRQYRQKLKGLFLRRLEEEQKPAAENSFLKVFLDYYSRLGALAGVSGDFPPALSFRSGLGVSRNLYNYNGKYTPWVLDPVAPDYPKYSSSWNEAWLFGLQLPFRYGLDAKWNLTGSLYRFTGKFELYSDPFFASDFYNRAEETDIPRLLGVEPQSGTTEAAEGEKRGLSWEASGQADLTKPAWAPYIKRLSIPYLNANLYWQSRTNALVQAGEPDPSRLFFYPVSLKLPNMALQASGELISVALGEGGRARPEAGPAPAPGLPRELRGPQEEEQVIEEPAAGEADRETEATPLRRPNPRADLASPPPSVPASFVLSYQVQPSLLVEQSFNSEGVAEPSAVRYDLNYTSLESSGSTSLDWTLGLYEQMLSLSGSLIFSGNYRTRFQQSFANELAWRELVHSDNRYSQMLIRNPLNLRLSPFYQDPRFRSTSLAYSLNWTLFRYALLENVGSPWVYGDPVYRAIPPAWDQNTVSQHQLQAILGWQPPGGKTNTMTLTAQLPPFQTTVTAKAEMYLWLLKTTIQGIFKSEEAGEYWPLAMQDPLVIQEALEIAEDVRLSEELQLDVHDGLVMASVSSLNLWGFSSSFTAQRLPAGGLEPANFSASYRLAETERYFWRNRARLQTAANASWTINLRNVVENNFSFSLNTKFFLYKFLEFSFTSVSYNNRTYRYFPGLAESQNVPYENPLATLTDLLRSFNIFNPDDRKASAFKLKSLQFDLVHHLHDWDLTIRYEGKPAWVTDAQTLRTRYEWSDSFSVLLQWIPIPEMRSTVRVDQNGFYIRG